MNTECYLEDLPKAMADRQMVIRELDHNDPAVTGGGGPCGVMVKVMDCGIVVSELELQLRYYVHFQANTLMNPLILPAMG